MIGQAKNFWCRWRWEIGSTVIALFLLAGFWIWWVYGINMDSPITPSHVVFLFLAMVKVSLFNILAWALAIPATRGDSDQTTWNTWAVLLFCLCLSALG